MFPWKPNTFSKCHNIKLDCRSRSMLIILKFEGYVVRLERRELTQSESTLQLRSCYVTLDVDFNILDLQYSHRLH